MRNVVSRFVFILVGLALIAGGGYLAYQRSGTTLQGERTEGTVIRLREKERDPGESPMIYHVFKFKAQDGQAYTVEGAVGSTSGTYVVGEKIPVVYDPDRPREARIDSFSEMWMGPLVIFLMGFIFVILGLYGRVRRTRC